ncbi:MAG: hypothetical protein H6701_12205 [Myxococcales bacterium]|nr:hypothetical protein [Myxococcales bacterium]
MSARCVQPARLIIECRPAGASVRIDGLGELQPCPARFERVPPGRYAGIALAAGVETPFEIEAEPGATTRIEVTLAQPSSPPVTTLHDPGATPDPDASITAPEQPAAPERELAPYAWTAAALAVVAGGVALSAAVYRVETIDDAEALNADARALDASDGDFSRDARRYNARYDALEEDHAVATDVVVGASVAAGVFAAVAVALFVFDADPSPSVGGLRVGVGVVSVEF